MCVNVKVCVDINIMDTLFAKEKKIQKNLREKSKRNERERKKYWKI